MAPSKERYLYPSEVAELLAISVKNVSWWARRGKLPFIRTLGGHRRYPESEILRLREQLTQPVTDPQAGDERP